MRIANKNQRNNKIKGRAKKINAAIANLPAISNYNKEANENRKLKSTQQLEYKSNLPASYLKST